METSFGNNYTMSVQQKHFDHQYTCQKIAGGSRLKAFRSIIKRKSIFDNLNSYDILKRKFQCDVCKQRFLFRSELSSHLKKHQVDMVKRNVEALIVTEIQLSKGRHSPCGKFQCDVCRQMFLYKSNLCSHLVKHQLFDMVKRNVEALIVTEIKLSKGRHNPCGKFQCDVCRQMFLYKSNLCSHLRKHQLNIKRDRRNSSNIKRPILKYVGNKVIKLYKCFPCDKTFKDKRLLVIHKKRHPNAYKPFKCDICDQTFAMKVWLENHIQRHVVDRNYPCDICGKHYLTYSDVIMHKRRHTLDRKFHCDVCKKNFVYRSELNSHLKKHQGVKLQRNIECGFCDKKFTTRRDLQRHTTSHTGEKSFECPLCAKRFSQEGNLQVHIKIHTNVKPFKCEECGKSFITNSKLVRHRLVHSKPNSQLSRPYKCSLCPCQYTTEHSLFRHLKKHSKQSLDNQDRIKNPSDALRTLNTVNNTSLNTKQMSMTKKNTLALLDKKHLNRKLNHKPMQTNLATQTPTFIPHLIMSDAEIKVEQDGIAVKNEYDLQKEAKNHPTSVEIIVKPKSTVVNYGPKYDRRLAQKTAIVPNSLPSRTVKFLPIVQVQNNQLTHQREIKLVKAQQFIVCPTSIQTSISGNTNHYKILDRQIPAQSQIEVNSDSFGSSNIFSQLQRHQQDNIYRQTLPDLSSGSVDFHRNNAPVSCQLVHTDNILPISVVNENISLLNDDPSHDIKENTSLIDNEYFEITPLQLQQIQSTVSGDLIFDLSNRACETNNNLVMTDQQTNRYVSSDILNISAEPRQAEPSFASPELLQVVPSFSGVELGHTVSLFSAAEPRHDVASFSGNTSSVEPDSSQVKIARIITLLPASQP